MDPRFKKIASTVMYHSLKTQPGEGVVISVVSGGDKLTRAPVEEAYACGAVPFVSLGQTTIRRTVLEEAAAEQLELMAKPSVVLMNEMDCHVAIPTPYNSCRFCLISQEKQTMYTKYCKGLVGRVKNKLRRMPLTYPDHGMAQSASMSLSEFSDYYFDLMTMDYDKLEKASLPMALRMRTADQIRIVTPDTDLTVSLEGFTALIAAGEHNLPDREITSALDRCSVNDAVSFDVSSMHNDFLFTDVYLTLKNGKVVEASANDTRRFLKRASLDKSCRCIGEFSMGTSPYVQRIIHETLFGEKIGGSMRTALSTCYNFPDRDSDNRSNIHWDLIQSHRPKHGGGEVWIDGELVRKDGIYLPEDLRVLDPDIYFTQD